MFNPTPQQKKNLKKWIKALRSGKYVQGRGTLERTLADGSKQHCCLGVACREFPEMIRSETIKRFSSDDESKTFFTFKDSVLSYHGAIPSKTFVELFDLDTYSDLIYESKTMNTFMLFNDSSTEEHHTFNEIANVLEDYLIACEVLKS